jgi:hypothetical protein
MDQTALVSVYRRQADELAFLAPRAAGQFVLSVMLL